MKKTLLLLAMLTGVITACEETFVEPDPKAMGYDYYPLEIGDYRVYNVTDIKFRSNVGDTSRFQIRELVDTSFYDQSNTLNYKIVRAVRADDTKPWVEDSVMTVLKSNGSVLLTQNNTTFVKLVFPVKENKTWAGDAFNNNVINVDEKEPYTYTNVGESYTVRGQVFDKTATVIQGNPTNNLVQLNDRKEVYAEGVGRIYRLYNKVVYCNETQSVDCNFGEDFKLFGTERHEELVTYGKR
ncbi:hypothetical protein [Pontibacter rugosus]|uniref:DKNYY family protein n=1 Tax=Pontibacter rugosus TaxID=1745966 RepID=A0ABW3STV8_9BACT